MRIEASQVSYVAAHDSASATIVADQTLVRPRISSPKPAATATIVFPPATGDTVQISALAGSSLDGSLGDLQNLDPKQTLALLAIEALLGHEVTLLQVRVSAATPDVAGNAPVGAAASSGAAVVHQRTEIHAEMEQTSFKAQGVVDTADGRSIRFSAELTMQRQFQSISVTTGASNAADPLVVNYGGAPVRLSGAKIAFDLNSDGHPQTISFVAGGSGFLALDSNGDGKVNNGQELFGPQTGNGFAELAAYDADGNGWIDQNDPVFAKLRIWDQSGLQTLAEKGIGAISTSSAATPFALKDSANVLQADVRSTGIYLSENGAAGTIQQIDLAEG